MTDRKPTGLTLLTGVICTSEKYGEQKEFVLGVFDNQGDIDLATEKFNKLQRNFRRIIVELPISTNTYMPPYG